MFEVGSDLVESACLWGGFDQTDLPELGVCPCLPGFELGLGGVGAGDDGLAHIDLAGLMFAESVEGLVDQTGTWGATVNHGEIGFMDFPTLLHFSEEGGVFLAATDQEKAAGFTIESADEGERLIGVLVAQPVDQGESSVGSGGVNEPTGWFIHDEERGVLENDGRIHRIRLVQISVWVEA